MQASRLNTGMRIVLWGIIFVLSFSTSFAAQVIISWNPNSEPDLQGYRVYYGVESRNYTKTIDVGLSTSHTISNLAENASYYFAVTAYDDAGNESSYSEEVSVFIAPSDTTAPRITNVQVLDKTRIKIFFSEPIERNSAQRTGNYSISSGIAVQSAELLSDLSSVKLTTSVHNPGAYKITVNNIKDRAVVANTIQPNSFFNYVVLDTDPPQLTGAEIVSETQVDVAFSEPVQKNSAENISNYSINHGISVSGARLDADLKTIHLTTSVHGENSYTLTVNHIFDRAENPNEIPANTQATYQYVDRVKPELVRVDVISDIKLKVVFSEPLQQSSAENVANYQIESGVQVQNAHLKENLTEVELTTTPHVEQNYRLTVQHVKDRANSPNEIAADSHFDYEYIDTIAPELAAVQVSSDSELVVIFSESVEKNSAETAVNYSISGDIAVISARLDAGDAKKVFLKTTLHAEQTYTLTVTGVKDRAHTPNVISDQNQLSYEFIDHFPPQLTRTELIGDHALNIYFNEAVEKNSAENSANYSISPQVSILSAVLDANRKEVHLQTEQHAEGDYVLRVSNVRDRANSPNMIAGNSSLSYKYTDRIKPEVLQVICENDSIVKIQFTEPVAAASALQESNYSISPAVSVQDAHFGANEESVILKTSPHQEGSYLITINHIRDKAQNANEILANTTVQYEYIDSFAPELTALTVSAEDLLTIKFDEPIARSSAETASNYSINKGILVQQADLQGDNQTVFLHTTQHDEGNYSLTIVGISDRAASPNTITSPIVENYQFVDHTPPLALSAQAPVSDQVDVFFSEPMDKNSSEQISNYQISAGIIIYSATLDPDQTTVHLTTSKHEPGNYTLTISNVRDNSSQKNHILAQTQVSYQYIDLIPPGVVGVAAPLENRVEVEFSEPVEKSSAENVANYQINNGIQIENAVLDENLSVVRLQTTVHVPGDYVLTVNHIKDRAVNPNQMSAAQNISYSYVDLTPPAITNAQALSDTTVEIIFSEPVNAATAQNSENYLISNNVQVFSAILQGDQKTVLLLTSSHMPGQYVIEVKDVTDQAATPNTIPNGSRFSYQYLDQIPPELTNVISLDETHVDVYFSEPILRSSAENVNHYKINNNIQVLSAQMNGTGEIVHLQTSAHVPGAYRLTVSQILDRATPANVIAENSGLNYRYVDRTPPEPLQAEAIDETNVRVTFSEPLEKTSAENTANYSINGGIAVLSASLNEEGKIAHLTTTAHTPGQYTIHFADITDRAETPNRISSSAQISYEYVDRIPPAITNVICDSVTTVDVVFSEPVQKNSAENISNYSINHGISVSGARLDTDLKTIHLTTSVHGENSYTLTVNHIFDRAENPNEIPANTQATYQFVDRVKPELVRVDVISDIKLNVVFSEPLQQSSAENVANYQIESGVQVQGAHLKDNLTEVELTTTPHVEQNYRLTVQHVKDRANSPNEIAADSHFDYQYVDTIAPELAAIQVSSDSELVVIFSESVEKNSAETAANYSISGNIAVISARLNAGDAKKVFLKTTSHAEQTYTLTVTGVKDQAHTPNVIGGQNQLSYEFIDHFPPRAISAQANADTVVEVIFSEPMEKSSAENIANYLISPSVPVLKAKLDPAGKKVTLRTGIHSEGNFQLAIHGLTDRAKNPNVLPDGEVVSYRYQDTFPPTVRDLQVISDTKLRIRFSEPVEKNAAETVSNYVIDRDIRVISATLLSDLESVELVTSIHGEGIYNLTINGIKDQAQQPNFIAQNTTLQYQYNDTIAPSVVSVIASAEDTVKILFSEAMNQEKAENTGNYAVNKGIQIFSAKLSADWKTVTLVTSAHAEGSYQLELNNLCDRAQTPNFIPAHTQVSYSYVDIFPPQAISAEAFDPTTVIVDFSEPLNSTDAENASNYSINRGITVNSATVENNGSRVRLQTSLHTEADYILTVRNIRDRAQNPNVIVEKSLPYRYVDRIPPEAMSVTVVADTQLDVRFSEPLDKNSAEEITNYQISPNVLIVSALLAADTLTVHLVTAPHTEGSFTLQLKNIKDISSQANVIAAGTELSYAYVDQVKPTIVDVEAIAPTEVRVTFSEKITAETAEDSANYAVNNGIEILAARLDSSEKAVVLTTTAHQPGNYIIIIDNIEDRAQQPNTILPHSYFTYSYTDRMAPDVNQVEVVANDHLKVIFNERVQKESAENASNFKIKTASADVDIWQSSAKKNFGQNKQLLAGGGGNTPVQIQSLSLEIDQKTLHIFTEEQEPGDYMLEVQNIKDCAPQPNTLEEEKKVFYRVEDRTQPTIISVEAIQEDSVEIIFSEPVIPEMATDTANYQISGGIKILRATIDLSMTKVNLETSPHQNGRSYSLMVENITDMSDRHNQIAPGTKVDYVFVKQNPDKPQVVNFVSLESDGNGGLFARWEASGSSEIVNYKIYFGNESGNYTTVVDAGSRLSFTLPNLSEGATYFAAVTAVDNYGMESDFSNELSATVSMRDVTPPEISSVIPGSDTTLTVLFSERVARNSAEEIGNYQISRGIQVLSARLSDDDRTLYLATTPHLSGEYVLIVSGIEDVAPSPNFIPENYRVSYSFHPNDKVAPAVIDWRVISQNKLEIVFSELVSKNDAEKTANYIVNPAVMIFSANLNEAENSVILTTENHVPGVWYTMTVKAIHDLASPPNEIAQNTKFQYQFQAEDKIAPEIYSVRAPDSTEILVQFTEGVDATSAQDVKNYSIGGVEIVRAVRLMDLRTISLTTGRLEEGRVYEISASGISDLASPANTIANSGSYRFVFHAADFEAPQLISVEPVDATLLKLTFSEFLNRKSAELASNYSIDNEITVISARLDQNPNTVFLTTSAHSSGLYYKITVNGIRDTAPVANVIRANTRQEYYFFESDKTPPAAETCELRNGSELEITFNEIVSRESAENTANYLINPYVPIQSAFLDSSLKKVILQTSAHEPGKTYRILITGIADRADPPNKNAKPQTLTYMLPPETDFIADNLIPSRYEFAYLSIGDTCYLDAEERIQSVPQKIESALWIRTIQTDANNNNNAFLAFRLKKKANVFVGFDPDARNYPDWLIEKFHRTGEKIGFGGEFGNLDLWQAELDTGFVILGGNMASGAESAKKMYVVIIKPEADDNGLLPDTMSDPLSRSEVQKFQLVQNYPNPFNAETKIQFAVSDGAHVKIELFNILGQQVRVLLDAEKAPGRYLMLWDGKDANGIVVATGVYFMRMTALKNDGVFGNRVVFSKVRKMLFIR